MRWEGGRGERGGGGAGARATDFPARAPPPLAARRQPRPPRTSGHTRHTNTNPPPPPSLPHSKRQWALPTKVPGFWRTPLSDARYETAHDPGMRALRRKTLDEE